MTLHKEFREGLVEDLDILIRVALRDSVAGVEPPPHVWGRIKERVRKLTIAQQPREQVIFDRQWMFPTVARMNTFYLFADDALWTW
jgi:hypothetical protein